MASVPTNGVRPGNPTNRRVGVLPFEVPCSFLFSEPPLLLSIRRRPVPAGRRTPRGAPLVSAFSRRFVPRLVADEHGVHAPQQVVGRRHQASVSLAYPAGGVNAQNSPWQAPGGACVPTVAAVLRWTASWRETQSVYLRRTVDGRPIIGTFCSPPPAFSGPSGPSSSTG